MCHRHTTHTLTHGHGSKQWPRTNQYSMKTHTNTPNLMRNRNKSNFRELKSEHNVQRCEPIKLDEKESSKLNNKTREVNLIKKNANETAC